jgi:hypothetical protein
MEDATSRFAAAFACIYLLSEISFKLIAWVLPQYWSAGWAVVSLTYVAAAVAAAAAMTNIWKLETGTERGMGGGADSVRAALGRTDSSGTSGGAALTPAAGGGERERKGRYDGLGEREGEREGDGATALRVEAEALVQKEDAGARMLQSAWRSKKSREKAAKIREEKERLQQEGAAAILQGAWKCKKARRRADAMLDR